MEHVFREYPELRRLHATGQLTFLHEARQHRRNLGCRRAIVPRGSHHFGQSREHLLLQPLRRHRIQWHPGEKAGCGLLKQPSDEHQQCDQHRGQHRDPHVLRGAQTDTLWRYCADVPERERHHETLAWREHRDVVSSGEVRRRAPRRVEREHDREMLQRTVPISERKVVRQTVRVIADWLEHVVVRVVQLVDQRRGIERRITGETTAPSQR